MLYKEIRRKMSINSVKIKISKNKQMCFFLMSQGSFNQKIRFLGQKMWPVGRARTDGRTDTRTHRVTTVGTLSGFFPSTYHQGSAQYLLSFGGHGICPIDGVPCEFGKDIFNIKAAVFIFQKDPFSNWNHVTVLSHWMYFLTTGTETTSLTNISLIQAH